MKNLSKISIALLIILLINCTAFASGVKFVDNNSPKFSIFSFLNRFIAKPTANDVSEVTEESPSPTEVPTETAAPEQIKANSGTLDVVKNTPVDGRLSYTFSTPIDVTFAITTMPAKGTVDLTDPATGAFTYTPNTDEIGQDSFTFTVSSTNNGSDTGTITVNITESVVATPTPTPTPPTTSGFVYQDMIGHWAEFSAIKLSDEGVLTGYKIAGKYYFYPDTPLTRGDFLLYLIAALNLDVSTATNKASPFADASDVPAWLLQEANIAYDAGLIKGVLEGDKVYLRPNDTISRIEVIALLNNTIKPDTISADDIDYADKYLIPLWSYDSVRNMKQYGLLKGYDDNTLRPYVKITRAMSAEFLQQIINYKNDNPSLMKNIQKAINDNMYF